MQRIDVNSTIFRCIALLVRASASKVRLALHSRVLIYLQDCFPHIFLLLLEC